MSEELELEFVLNQRLKEAIDKYIIQSVDNYCGTLEEANSRTLRYSYEIGEKNVEINALRKKLAQYELALNDHDLDRSIMARKLKIADEALGEIYEDYRDSDKSAEYAADVHATAEVALAEIAKLSNT